MHYGRRCVLTSKGLIVPLKWSEVDSEGIQSSVSPLLRSTPAGSLLFEHLCWCCVLSLHSLAFIKISPNSSLLCAAEQKLCDLKIWNFTRWVVSWILEIPGRICSTPLWEERLIATAAQLQVI